MEIVEKNSVVYKKNTKKMMCNIELYNWSRKNIWINDMEDLECNKSVEYFVLMYLMVEQEQRKAWINVLNVKDVIILVIWFCYDDWSLAKYQIYLFVLYYQLGK